MRSGDSECAGFANTIAGCAKLLDLGLLETINGAELELWVTVDDLRWYLSVCRSHTWVSLKTRTYGTSHVLREVAAVLGRVVHHLATLRVATNEYLRVWALLLGLLDCIIVSISHIAHRWSASHTQLIHHWPTTGTELSITGDRCSVVDTLDCGFATQLLRHRGTDGLAKIADFGTATGEDESDVAADAVFDVVGSGAAGICALLKRHGDGD